MTPEERAEKTMGELIQYFDTYRIPKDRIESYVLSAQHCIAAEIASAVSDAVADKQSAIQAAVEEAQKACIGLQVEQCHKHVAQAYEDAAKIAEAEGNDWGCPDCHDAGVAEVVKLIRARAKEILGKELK